MSRIQDAAEPLLDVSGLTLQYKTPRHLVTAAYDVSFQVRQADRLILLGPSGCGKSTILKAVGGFIRPAGGSIRLKGVPVTGPGADRGMVFQEFDQLFPWKTALENISLAVRAAGTVSAKEAREEAAHLLDLVNLTGFGDAYPHELSGGMKQRVAIARCLALRSAVILMDEPFASLDAITRRKMQDELLGLWADAGFTLLFVTHSIEEALTLGTRIVMFSPHPGQIVAELNGVLGAGPENAKAATLRERISRILYKSNPDYVI
ncbi:MAG: ABC transporter ATP-binding protein [Desulfovibrio sp.]|nr:ABC transporter ATP-binding protein [Desulfovibrio sp.]